MTIGAAGHALMRVLLQRLLRARKRGLEQWLFSGLLRAQEQRPLQWLLR